MCLNSRCGKKIVTGIQCDACGEWEHPSCARISQEIFQLYDKILDLQWVCSPCIQFARAHRVAKRPVHAALNPTSTTRETDPGPVVMSSPTRLYSEVVNQPPKQGTSGGPVPNKLNTKEGGEGLRPKRKRTKKNQGGVKTVSQEKDTNELKLEAQIKETILKLGMANPCKTTKRNSSKTILVLNTEEPLIKESKTRRDMDRRRVIDLLRIAGIHPNTGIKRVHRVGVWKQTNPGRLSPARPILVEFKDSEPRDLLLTRAAFVNNYTKGRYQIVPDIPKPALRSGSISKPGKTAPHHHTPETSKAQVGFVVIEDILEEEEWRTCPQSRARVPENGQMETPLMRAPPTDLTAIVIRSQEVAPLVDYFSEPKNVVTRALRPRTKKEKVEQMV